MRQNYEYDQSKHLFDFYHDSDLAHNNMLLAAAHRSSCDFLSPEVHSSLAMICSPVLRRIDWKKLSCDSARTTGWVQSSLLSLLIYWLGGGGEGPPLTEVSLGWQLTSGCPVSTWVLQLVAHFFWF